MGNTVPIISEASAGLRDEGGGSSNDNHNEAEGGEEEIRTRERSDGGEEEPEHLMEGRIKIREAAAMGEEEKQEEEELVAIPSACLVSERRGTI